MMKDRTTYTNRDQSGGNALILIIPVIFGLGLVCATLISWLQTEVQVNNRHILRQEALLAAESALEYGAAQLSWRFDRSGSVVERIE